VPGAGRALHGCLDCGERQELPPRIRAFALLPNWALAMPHFSLDVTMLVRIAKKVRERGCKRVHTVRPLTDACLLEDVRGMR